MTDRGFYFRWFIGGIVLLLLVAGACYLWYHYDTAPYRREAAKTEAFARQWEKNQKAQSKATTAKQATDGTPAESDTQSAEKQGTDTTVTKETAATPGQTGAAAEKTETAEVRVSPHGFGPYPEVPEDYPIDVEWEENPDNPDRTYELMDRVFVKLWKSGEKNFYGGSIQDGKVYPHYYDTVYIGIKETRTPGGAVTRVTRRKSGPFVRYTLQQLEENPPPHIRILDLETSGIDPYQYLDLP